MSDIPTAVILAATLAGAVVLDEKSLVPVGSACGAALALWWAGRKWQKVEDSLENLKTGQQEIREKVDDLPCVKRQLPCEPKKSVD